MYLRPIRKRELTSISLLERSSFEVLSDADLKKELDTYSGFVMELPSFVHVGYLVYDLFHGNFLVRRFTIDRCHQSAGYGTSAMGWLKGKTTKGYFVEFTVNEYNVYAQTWLRRFGFRYERTIKRPKSDLYVMRWING